MWYEYQSHYIPSKKRSLICSCGPHRDKPCWSCVRRHVHYETERAKRAERERETGVREKKAMDKPPIDAYPQMAFGITIMENIFAVPLLNSDGTPRTAKNGTPILKYVPESLMGRNTSKIKLQHVGFGRRAHLSVSRRGLNQIIQLDDVFCARHCANCAHPMKARRMTCPECEESIKLDEPLEGTDLEEAMTDNGWTCGKCDYTGSFVPKFSCEHCGNPERGWLTNFDVKLRSVKSSDEDKSSTLQIVGVRMPKTDDPEVLKMVSNSLDLPAIFAPSPLDEQVRLLGDLIKGLESPLLPKKDKDGGETPPSRPYDTGTKAEAEAEDDELEDDLDDASFD